MICKFHASWVKAFAAALIESFQGNLQPDGYGVYGALAQDRPGLKAMGCWSQGRRKFVEALEEWLAAAVELVTDIRKLYLIEGYARDDRLDAGPGLRQKKAAPILAGAEAAAGGTAGGCLPQSPLGTAIRYTLAEWEPLTWSLEDGRLEIDNNLTENTIRPSAVEEKNRLFIGHPQAGWRSAVI